QIVERNMKIDVSSAFLQVLLNKEIVELTIDNRERTQQQHDRVRTLFDLRQATKADVLEVEAQLKLDQYTETKAVNDLAFSKLLLQQLLNIPTRANFEIVNVFNDSTLFLPFADTSISSLPEIKKMN